MALEIEDVGFQNQVCEDETFDRFHNINQVRIQNLAICNIHELNLCGIHYMLNLSNKKKILRENGN
jgi:hypothetical protein